MTDKQYQIAKWKYWNLPRNSTSPHGSRDCELGRPTTRNALAASGVPVPTFEEHLERFPNTF